MLNILIPIAGTIYAYQKNGGGGGIKFVAIAKNPAVLLFCCALLTACDSQVPVEDISRPPVFSPADKPYADVFRALDGVWEGEFHVYVDERGQAAGPARPEELRAVMFANPHLRKQLTIRVRQEYVSETPYFQRVKIRDSYVDAGGELRVVESRGVNKVQDGRLWCVVQKPDERVVHAGRLRGGDTIVWRRDLRRPLKIEYFEETVLPETYTILGWGYYGNDDPERGPRTWFYGEYRRAAPPPD